MISSSKPLEELLHLHTGVFSDENDERTANHPSYDFLDHWDIISYIPRYTEAFHVRQDCLGKGRKNVPPNMAYDQ